MCDAPPAPPPRPRPRVAVTALGCKVSAADARLLESRLAALARDCELVPFPEPADVYVLFTCTVTHAADRETRKQVSRLRRLYPAARLVLTGCLAEVGAAEAAAIPGVWRVISHHRLAEIPALLHEPEAGPPSVAPGAAPVADARRPAVRSRSSRTDARELPPTSPGALSPLRRGLDRPFLKVQDGCNTCCAYCILPRARGRARSRPVAEVLPELRRLEEEGAAEVVLTGINLGSWGKDLRPASSLPALLEELLAVTRLRRLRLSSLEPESLTPALLDLLARAPALCHHLHVPLQSGDDEVLRRMGRPYDTRQYTEAVLAAAERLPGLGLGTDLIVGFPGEEREAHQRTVELVGRLPFSYLHVFSFSPRRGTRAAALPDDVPPPEKRRRSRELIALGEQARDRAFARVLGQPLEVLLERRPDPASGGRTRYSREYLPVLLPEAGTASGIVQVQITGAVAGRLQGQLLEER